MECIFCQIIAGKIPANVVYEDDQIIAFKDIFPKADVHILVVPKIHIESLAHLAEEHAKLMSHLTLKLKDIAKDAGLKGFRTIINTGPEGGQEVPHIHYHILGGSNLPGFGPKQ